MAGVEAGVDHRPGLGSGRNQQGRSSGQRQGGGAEVSDRVWEARSSSMEVSSSGAAKSRGPVKGRVGKDCLGTAYGGSLQRAARAHFHQDEPQHVFAAAVFAAAPVVVVVGVLHDLLVAGGEQDLAELGMPPNFARIARRITSSFTSSQSARSGLLRSRPRLAASLGEGATWMSCRSFSSRNFCAWKKCSVVGHHSPSSRPRGPRSWRSSRRAPRGCCRSRSPSRDPNASLLLLCGYLVGGADPAPSRPRQSPGDSLRSAHHGNLEYRFARPFVQAAARGDRDSSPGWSRRPRVWSPRSPWRSSARSRPAATWQEVSPPPRAGSRPPAQSRELLAQVAADRAGNRGAPRLARKVPPPAPHLGRRSGRAAGFGR